MNKTALLNEITKLPLDDQVALVQEVWEQIADNNVVLPLSDRQRSELERRSAELEANPELAIPWQEVRRQLEERHDR